MNESRTLKSQNRIESQIQNQEKILLNINNQSIKSTKILSNINKTITKINSISAIAYIDISKDHELLKKYMIKLEKNIKILLSKPNQEYNGMHVSGGIGNHVSLISIPQYSKEFPSVHNEMIINRLMRVGIRLIFYKNPVSVDKIEPNIYGTSHDPDLRIPLTQTNDVELQFKPYNSSLRLFSELNTKEESWESNGGITSFSDLSGTQLVILISYPKIFEKDEDNRRLSELYSKLKISTIKLRINNMDLWLNEYDFKQIKLKSGSIAWTIVFPENYKKIIEHYAIK